MKSRTAHKKTDAVIIGGGLSGLALAASLGAAGLSVTVLERNTRRAAERGARSDARTTALSYGSTQILKAAGVWQSLQKHACPILDIRVADGNAPVFLDFCHSEVSGSPFGWIVENHLFARALWRRLSTLKAVRIVTAAVMERLETNENEARVILKDGRVFAAALAIGADGRNSACRAQAGIPVHGWNYGQTAMACTIAHEKPHHNVAVEHFLPGGPLATFPMTRKRSSIVWTEKTAAAQELVKMSDADFTAALQDKVQDWLGAIRLAGPRGAFPLSLQYAGRLTAHRLALVGDAAHGIHPIAGQGFNLGIGDIGALAEELRHAACLGLDPGDPAALDRFEKRRRFANGNMVLMTDALDRLFSNAVPPVEGARRFGLNAVQHMPPLKRFFMRQAMGVRRMAAGRP